MGPGRKGLCHRRKGDIITSVWELKMERQQWKTGGGGAGEGAV
jgi:hypothetical protein